MAETNKSAQDQAQQFQNQASEQTREFQNRLQDQTRQVQDQMRQQYDAASELTGRSLKTWNDMAVASTDMAFDAVLRNWNYSKTVRAEADRALETTITQQRQFASEMASAFQGYAANVQTIADDAARNTTKR